MRPFESIIDLANARRGDWRSHDEVGQLRFASASRPAAVIPHTEVCHSLARQARDPVPNLSVKNVRVAVLRASD